jgi:hypothetical protein
MDASGSALAPKKRLVNEGLAVKEGLARERRACWWRRDLLVKGRDARNKEVHK